METEPSFSCLEQEADWHVWSAAPALVSLICVPSNKMKESLETAASNDSQALTGFLY